jgi:hypothetical protein
LASDEYIRNLLNSLANAQDYHCYIFSYERGHHQLTLAVHDPDSDSPEPSFYLHFEPTYYFEGPTGWTGADFRLATKNEWEEVLSKLAFRLSGDLKDEFVRRHFLFVLEKPNFHIRILSALFHKVMEAIYVSVSLATSHS